MCLRLTAAVTLQFDGTQFMKVKMPRKSVTKAEDVTLRFRTMADNGLLFVALGVNGNHMKLDLRNGTLHLSVNVGSGSKVGLVQKVNLI